jgi:hypothetical protein
MPEEMRKIIFKKQERKEGRRVSSNKTKQSLKTKSEILRLGRIIS